jgi:hypothetical protein
MSDLVERVVDEMLRVRAGGGGVEHEAHVAIALALEEAAKVTESYEPRCDTCPRGVAAAIRAMIPTGTIPAQDDTGSAK